MKDSSGESSDSMRITAQSNSQKLSDNASQILTLATESSEEKGIC